MANGSGNVSPGLYCPSSQRKMCTPSNLVGRRTESGVSITSCDHTMMANHTMSDLCQLMWRCTLWYWVQNLPALKPLTKKNSRAVLNRTLKTLKACSMPEVYYRLAGEEARQPKQCCNGNTHEGRVHPKDPHEGRVHPKDPHACCKGYRATRRHPVQPAEPQCVEHRDTS
jgi:hypothetical protein